MRRPLLLLRGLVAAIVAIVTVTLPAFVQSGFDDDRVLLQGFYWESYRHGHDGFPNYGSRHWYEIVRDQAPAIREARFDLVWLPPPSFAGDLSAGYDPREYFNLANSYGTFPQHRAMLETLLRNGVEPVADLVLNHRNGNTGWVDFKNPDWGLWAITRGDEAFFDSASGVANTPESQRGAAEEHPAYVSHTGTTYQYPSFRDIDHSNAQVRRDILKSLLQLKSAGYRAWRYDMVHGYHARWVALYNKRSEPTFSVGEYDWDRHADMRGWVFNTATVPGDLKTASSVFDFTTMFTLKANKGRYLVWYGFGNGLGMMGDTTDGLPWKQRSVTFLENHDTGYRTNLDGTPEQGHESDSFQNTWEVEQAYAYILTHPGLPSVYWKHYFDWGSELQNKIRALVNARKVAGVTTGSTLRFQDNARAKGVYAALVSGTHGDLYVRIGGSDNDWNPSQSGHTDFREYAYGAGWKVWVKLPGNPPVQQAPLKGPLPVPSYRDAAAITIPDDWLR
jgi:alpha-amylase